MGFSGQYRMLLKRVWGQSDRRKVTVDIVTHYGSGQAQSYRQQIPLTDKDAAAVFDLADGRRQEPLEAQLSRQRGPSPGRPSAGRSSVSNCGPTRTRTRCGTTCSAVEAERTGRMPRRNAVGVRPQITVLPEGTNFNASAVISADRRYVRVTPMPLFSGIGDVTTFNVTSDGNNQGGGGGGLGGGGGGGLGGGGGGGGGIF